MNLYKHAGNAISQGYGSLHNIIIWEEQPHLVIQLDFNNYDTKKGHKERDSTYIILCAIPVFVIPATDV